jgi:transposase
MTYIRYKKFGKKEYAYEVNATWDPIKKQSKNKTKYLGIVIDKGKKRFRKRKTERKPEKLILDFGDGFILKEFFDRNNFTSLIKKSFGSLSDSVLALISFRLCYPSAMTYSKEWFSGNYSKLIYKNANMNSQRISDLFKVLGEESIHRKFFKEYINRYAKSKEGFIIDATSLPNQIHIPVTMWGRKGEEIDKQIRFLLVVDKATELPLYFRYYAGSIVDVSTLQTTIAEIEKFGIKNSYAFLDAGYFSEDNILALFEKEINFLTRLPSGRLLYKKLIKSEIPKLEKVKNLTRYGKRGLFIKQKKIKLFGKSAYAHIILDLQRKGREVANFSHQYLDEKELNEKELEYRLSTKGVMILVSSFNLKKEEVVPSYYTRQTAEKLFGFSKDDLDLIPLRVHREDTLRGFLLLQFLTLIAFVQLKKKLKKHTVDDLLLTMRNLKCKIFKDEILVSELTRKQKDFAQMINILVPKRVGV